MVQNSGVKEFRVFKEEAISYKIDLELSIFFVSHTEIKFLIVIFENVTKK